MEKTSDNTKKRHQKTGPITKRFYKSWDLSGTPIFDIPPKSIFTHARSPKGIIIFLSSDWNVLAKIHLKEQWIDLSLQVQEDLLVRYCREEGLKRCLQILTAEFL